MSSITIFSPTLTGGSANFEITTESEDLVGVTVNPKNYESVKRIKLLYAAAITQTKLIGQAPAGNVEAAVEELLASMKNVVALAEASTDF